MNDHVAHDSNERKQNSGDRFVFHEKVLDDFPNLGPHREIVLAIAGRIMHLRRLKNASVFRFSARDQARRLGVSTRTVQRAINVLIERDHIDRVGGEKSATFRLGCDTRCRTDATHGVAHNRPEDSEEYITSLSNSVISDLRRTPTRTPHRSRRIEDWTPSGKNVRLVADLAPEQIQDLIEEYRDWITNTGIPVRKWDECWPVYVEKMKPDPDFIKPDRAHIVKPRAAADEWLRSRYGDAYVDRLNTSKETNDGRHEGNDPEKSPR